MAKIDTKDLFNLAQELRDQREEILEKQNANREMLRNLRLSGLLSEEEEEALEAFYPTRVRTAREESEGEEGEE